MACGDHLVVSYGLYTHHGVDLGDGAVAHYGGFLAGTADARVELVDIATFTQDLELRVNDVAAAFSPDEIVRRAQSRVGEQRYSLLANNCEHFVYWCRLGHSRSRQIQRVAQRVGSAATKFAARRVIKHSARRATTVAARSSVRVATPWLLAADALQLGAEVTAAGLGASDDRAEQAGQAVGLSASLGVGFLAAGPAGAAFGAGAWATGEAVGKLATGDSTQQSDLHDEKPL